MLYLNYNAWTWSSGYGVAWFEYQRLNCNKLWANPMCLN